MKKTFLLIMISTGMLSSTANAVEIYNKNMNKIDFYGKVDTRHVFSDNKSQDGDNTYVRFGIRGETNITDKLTGFGQWEYNVIANNAESEGSKGSATRLAFAGLKFGDLGALDYGRNYGVIYDMESWTDMLPAFGGDTYVQGDNFMIVRGNSMLTYRNSDFFGLAEGVNFALQYQGKNGGAGESNNNRGARSQNGDGYGLSASYESDVGISVGAAYANSDRTNEQQRETGNTASRAEAWNTGIKYDDNNIYLAATYAETRNMTWVGGSKTTLACTVDCGGVADKTQNLEIVAQYQFDSGLRPSLAYLQSKAKGRGMSEDVVKYIEVGTYYYFNKNMLAYVDYKINLLDNSNFTKEAGISTDNAVGIGLTYQF